MQSPGHGRSDPWRASRGACRFAATVWACTSAENWLSAVHPAPRSLACVPGSATKCKQCSSPYGADHATGDCVTCRVHRCQFCDADADSCETCAGGELSWRGGGAAGGSAGAMPLALCFQQASQLAARCGHRCGCCLALHRLCPCWARWMALRPGAGYRWDAATRQCRPCSRPHCGHCSSSSGEEVCDGCKPGYRLVADSNNPLDWRCTFDGVDGSSWAAVPAPAPAPGGGQGWQAAGGAPAPRPQ